MTRCPIRLLWCVALALFATAAWAQAGQPGRDAAGSSQPPVREIAIDGAIGPATSDYVEKKLQAAAAADAPAVILRLDTPGGLSSAMRRIVKAILASPVPVVGYVGPSGARAASAGTYVLYATHIAAMAPATNLGAATPVNIGPGGPAPDDAGKKNNNDKNKDADDDNRSRPADSATAERRKMVNDAVAYIRSLAEKRARNADWAERAVREGVSLTAKQAKKKNVIGLIADSERALLGAVDGRTVTTADGRHTLAVADAAIQQEQPGWRTRFLSVITNPTVAYLLFMIGIFGLILEGLNPGSTVPGVVGAICLVCALFAFQVLPVNYAGLALIVLGVGLMIAELFAPSFGMLGLGGICAFVFGSIMLMDTGVPGFEIPMGLIAGIAVAGALLLMLLIYMFLRSRGERVYTGHSGLLGRRCVAVEDFEQRGRVRLQGELWLAVCDTPVASDDELEVVAVEGLTVTVRPVEAAPPAATQH